MFNSTPPTLSLPSKSPSTHPMPSRIHQIGTFTTSLALSTIPHILRILHGTFAQGCENGCGAASADGRSAVGGWLNADDRQAEAVVDQLLHRHRPDGRAASQGPGSGPAVGWASTTPNTTPAPRRGCAPATPTPSAKLVGLTEIQRAGGEAETEVVARWLDDGVAPNGAHGRAFGQRGVHGFDLTFCAPKSVSLVRALGTDDVVGKAIADAHTTALAEAMEYLAAHAGYTRVHNPLTGEKDLVRLPGLVAIAYQHETSRCGDPHLHTHVIVPNRQARADGQLVSIDGTSLYHEAKAAGVIYQATLRRELHQSMGFEWAPVDPSTGMAELAGVDRDDHHRVVAALHPAARVGGAQPDGGRRSAVGAQLAVAQKATRPAKPEELAWAQLVEQWRADERGLHLDRAALRCCARGAARGRARAFRSARAWPRRRSRSRRRRSPAPT